ncbi:MAG: hypothetical protein NTV88_00340 [Candidatus Micrarchaeota archaeon]|nr:hypothetical protein [Candidatus Micrarchaeota archaeon]
MDFKFERNDIYAVLIVFLLSFGILFFPLKSTLPEFGAATQIGSALSGKAAAPYVAVAAAIAPLFGATATNPQSIVEFLMIFPPLLLALTSLFLYAAIRQLSIKRTPAAFAAVLFPLSLSAFSFLPGVYSSAALAALFFALFLFFFFTFASQKKTMMLVPAILFAALSAYINAAFGIAGIVAVLSFAANAYLKGDKRLPQFAVLAIVFAAAMYFSTDATGLYFNAKNIGAAFALMPFIVAAASVSAVLFFMAKASVDHFLLFIAGLFTAVFSPLAGALLLAIPAAGGISSDPQYSDKDMSGALLFLSGENAQSIAILGSADAARFYSPGAALSSQQDFTSYLLTGAPKMQSGTYAVLSLAYFDDQLSGGNFDSFFYANNFTSGTGKFALFYSTSGRLLAREVAADGSFALKDGVLLDGSGRQYAAVPLSRMLMLVPEKQFTSQSNRMIVLEEGASLPYFMKIYSGGAAELTEKGEFGKVSVYKVN